MSDPVNIKTNVAVVEDKRREYIHEFISDLNQLPKTGL